MENKQEDQNEEAKANVEALGEMLYKIYLRLVSEGYTITKDGVIDPDGKVVSTKII